jgi:hypothetical protein
LLVVNERQPMRLSWRHQRWIYIIGIALFLSGCGWLVDHYLFAESSEFGAHTAMEPLWLRLHGAAAMAGLVVFGSLFPGHIARAVRLRRNRRSGVVMASLVLLLTVTGYGLYYVGDEAMQPWISAIHWGVGFVAAAALVIHVWLGRAQDSPPRRRMAHRGATAVEG